MVRMRLEPQDDYLHAVGGRLELQREPLLQLLRPGPGARRHGRLGADGQPAQRGLRRDDGVPLPARRARRRSCSSDRASTVTTRTTPAACASRSSRRTRSTTSPTTARCACSPTRATWPSRRPRSTTTRTRACTIDLNLQAVGRPWGGEPEWEEGEERPTSTPRRCSPAATPSSTWRSRARSTVGDEHVRDHRRPRPPRPLVGPALLAEHLVVPMAHREPRPEARLRVARSRGVRGGSRRPHASTASSTTSTATATTDGCRSATAG